MTKKITIAIDAMGGENAPTKNIEGLKIFLDKHKNNSDYMINLYGDKNILNHKRMLARYRLSNVKVSHSESIMQDFAVAYCVINYNSSPAVAAAIEGIPTIVLDPNRSQAAEVSHHSLSDIENLTEFDREKWIYKMAQMHWTLDELKDGTAWRHLRKWAIK